MGLIESKLTNGVLDLQGTKVVVSRRDPGSRTQQWELRRAKTLTYWNLKSVPSSQMLVPKGPAEGADLVVDVASGDDQQRWVFNRDGGLQNRASGLLVTVIDEGGLGYLRTSRDAGGSSAQRWAVTDLHSGLRLDSELHPGSAITIELGKAYLLGWNVDPHHQRWTLEGPVQADVFWIWNEGSGLVAAAASRSADAEIVPVKQQGAFDDDLQLWVRYQPTAGSPFLLRCVATGLVATVGSGGGPVHPQVQAPEADDGQMWNLIM